LFVLAEVSRNDGVGRMIETQNQRHEFGARVQ